MDDAVFSFWRKEHTVLCLGVEVQGEDPWLTTPEEGRVSLRLGAGSWGAEEEGGCAQEMLWAGLWNCRDLNTCLMASGELGKVLLSFFFFFK